MGGLGGAGAGADGRLDMRIVRRYRSVADDTWQYPVSYPVGSTNQLLTELDRSPYGSVRWRRPAARVIDLPLLIGPVVWLFSAVPTQPAPNSGVDDWALGVQILAVLASIVWFVVLWPVYEIVAVGVSADARQMDHADCALSTRARGVSGSDHYSAARFSWSAVSSWRSSPTTCL